MKIKPYLKFVDYIYYHCKVINEYRKVYIQVLLFYNKEADINE